MKCIRCGHNSTQVYCSTCEKTYGKPATILAPSAALLQQIRRSVKNKRAAVTTGKLYYPNGALKYEGALRDQVPEGKGVMYAEDGRKIFEGEFSRGVLNGNGICYGKDNSRYEGNWEGGRWNGKGTLFYEDGSRLEGSWKNHVLHGAGKFFHTNGTCRYRVYDNGKLVKEGDSRPVNRL